jgi:hypothetical protein
MSYRAFKRLLGETSLERKCRFLFGAFLLLLMTFSFWLYHYLTGNLAYEQTKTACRYLVNPILAKEHLNSPRFRQENKELNRLVQSLEDAESATLDEVKL